VAAAAAAAVAHGAAARSVSPAETRRGDGDGGGMPPPLDDPGLEAAAAAERDSLMGELVAAKIELAEAQGDRARAARAALRARGLRDEALRAVDGVRAALLLRERGRGGAGGAAAAAAAAAAARSSPFSGRGAGRGRRGGSGELSSAGNPEGDEAEAPALAPEVAAALARAAAEILRAAEECS